jgi:maleate cis-trans isomerase
MKEPAMMSAPPRIGLIVPASNTAAEVQFRRYAPADVGVHVTRLRMTGQWQRPLRQLDEPLAEAAAMLSDTSPGVIVFHCTSNSMQAGLEGEAHILEVMEKASGCPGLTTSLAVREALECLRLRKLVLISPYLKATNDHERQFLGEAGFDVIHDLGLGLSGGGDEYLRITPREWIELTLENRRAQADGYFLSCTATTMIEAVEELEGRLQKPVVNSNQAVLWAALRRLGITAPIPGLGRLFRESAGAVAGPGGAADRTS